MLKIEITIPQQYNDKTPIEPTKHDKIQRELRQKFGGLSVSGLTTGQWFNPEDLNVYKDLNQIYTIVTNQDIDSLKSWLSGYKKWLEHNLNQEEIFILVSEVHKID